MSTAMKTLAGAAAGSAMAGLVWGLAYQISGGSALIGLAGGHALAGGALALLLIDRGRGSSIRGFLASGALLVAGPAALNAAEPALAHARHSVRLAALAAIGALMTVLAVRAVRLRWGRAALAVALVTSLAWLVLVPRPMDLPAAIDPAKPEIATEAPLSRVAVLGIDGGDWSVIDPMLRAGELPALAGLLQNGARGILRSIDPMYSPVVWTSIFSGMTPAQHGIRDWYTATAVNRRVPLLWDVLGASGQPSIAVNIPGSWPPRAFPGAIVAGFPMPRLTVSETALAGQFLGRVVTSRRRAGLVPSVTWPVPGGRIPIGREQIVARTAVRHPLVEAGLRRRWLAGAVATLDLVGSEPLATEGPLRVQAGGRDLELRRDEWSPWIDVEAGGHRAFLRIRRLESGELYVTPPFQSPRDPRFPFTAGDLSVDAFAPDGRYVVEGVGWKAAADDDLRTALDEHLEQVAELQARAAMLLAHRPWQLFAFVFTLSDRISHAFWRDHDPAPFGGSSATGYAAAPDRVRDAYRTVDRDLGHLLPRLGSDVTVFVVSDHGFTADPSHGTGGHRAEGIFIASGPGIRSGGDPVELSVYDVAPTILAGLGFPVAGDMPGKPRVDLFESAPEIRVIPSYGSSDSTDVSQRIDQSTEEQLRSLGYIQ